MRLHGYCTSCHRVKLVRVRVPTTHSVPMGLCADCEEKQQERWAR